MTNQMTSLSTPVAPLALPLRLVRPHRALPSRSDVPFLRQPSSLRHSSPALVCTRPSYPARTDYPRHTSPLHPTSLPGTVRSYVRPSPSDPSRQGHPSLRRPPLFDYPGRPSAALVTPAPFRRPWPIYPSPVLHTTVRPDIPALGNTAHFYPPRHSKPFPVVPPLLFPIAQLSPRQCRPLSALPASTTHPCASHPPPCHSFPCPSDSPSLPAPSRPTPLRQPIPHLDSDVSIPPCCTPRQSWPLPPSPLRSDIPTLPASPPLVPTTQPAPHRSVSAPCGPLRPDFARHGHLSRSAASRFQPDFPAHPKMQPASSRPDFPILPAGQAIPVRHVMPLRSIPNRVEPARPRQPNAPHVGSTRPDFPGHPAPSRPATSRPSPHRLPFPLLRRFDPVRLPTPAQPHPARADIPYLPVSFPVRHRSTRPGPCPTVQPRSSYLDEPVQLEMK